MGQTIPSWMILQKDMVFGKTFAVRDYEVLMLHYERPDEVTWGVRVLYWRKYAICPRYFTWAGSRGAFIPGRWLNA